MNDKERFMVAGNYGQLVCCTTPGGLVFSGDKWWHVVGQYRDEIEEIVFREEAERSARMVAMSFHSRQEITGLMGYIVPLRK